MVSCTTPVLAANPSGQYPEDAPLAPTTMSGRTSQCSQANQRPVRPKPVITSSAISRMPCLRHTDATAGQ